MGTFSAFVLAAGFGTRLRPLTDEIPKPLLPVGPEPLLVATLRALHEAGARSLWINAHHRSDQICSVVEGLSFKVHVNVEARILGTAGGLAAVRERVTPPVVLVNGDIVTELPLPALSATRSPGLTLAVTAPRSEPVGESGARVGEGSVGLDAEGRVVRLRGERFGREVRGADYIGVAILGAECWQTLPDEGCLIGDWALPHLRAGGTIASVWSPAPFRDLGDPRSYLEANLERLGQTSWVAPGVQRPPSVELERSAVGVGAQLLGRGVIRDSVVLPGARATAPLERCIVLPSGRVVDVA